MTTKLIFTILMFVNSIFCYSQVAKNDFSIGIGLGIDIISFKDISSSPLKYLGFGLPLYIQFKYKIKRTIHQLDLNAISNVITNNYILKNKVNTHLLSWNKINVDYRFLYQLKDNLNYIGSSINTNFFYREYDFLDGESWEFIGSLNIDYLREIAIFEKFTLIPNISLPLFGFIHRKPSLTLDEQFLDDFHKGRSIIKYGKWKTIFNQWFNIKFNVEYEFIINAHLTVSAKTGVQYYYINFPEKVSNFNFPILCHIDYHF